MLMWAMRQIRYYLSLSRISLSHDIPIDTELSLNYDASIILHFNSSQIGYTIFRMLSIDSTAKAHGVVPGNCESRVQFFNAQF